MPGRNKLFLFFIRLEKNEKLRKEQREKEKVKKDKEEKEIAVKEKEKEKDGKKEKKRVRFFFINQFDCKDLLG